MHDHFATADEARAVVGPFLDRWEMSAALTGRPDDFLFSYETAKVIDRDGPVMVAEGGSYLIAGAGTVSLLEHLAYPAPPVGLARDNRVDLMFMRYCRYFEKRTTPGDAANFCLTMVEDAVGGPPRGRRARAAEHYMIHQDVFNMLGTLAATKGGREARKAEGVWRHSNHGTLENRFEPEDVAWLEAAMKTIIHRVAEVAADPDPKAKRTQITMTDLPPR